MPVIFDTPKTVGMQSSTLQFLSLRAECGLPSNAAIALFYVTNDTASWGTSCYFLADAWYPGVDTSTTTTSIARSVPPYMKNFAIANLGPEGFNPDNNVWVGKWYSGLDITCVGYFTHDEVVIFPEVMSANRESDYLIPSSPEGGWGSISGGDVYEAENIWNIPTMRAIGATKPTGLIWDMNYDGIAVYPRNAEPSLLSSANLYTKGYSNFSGFDDTGDVWVWGNEGTGSYAALMGYFTVPIHWYMKYETSPRHSTFMAPGLPYLYRFDRDAAFGLFEMNDATQNWAIRRPGTSQVGDHKVITDTYVRYRFGMLCALDADTEEAYTYYSNDIQESGDSNVVLGYLVKQEYAEAPVIDMPDMSILAPELYYPPDNVGSLHINYSINGAGYAYSDINNLKLYLSGGLANTDPNASLGGVMSSTELLTGLNALFDDIPDVESYVGVNEYRCLYLVNSSGTEVAGGVKAWIDSIDALSVTFYIGEDPSGLDGEAVVIVSETSTPAGVNFTLGISENSCYTLDSLGPGQSIGLWFKRDVVSHNSLEATPDTATLNVSVLNDEG